MGLWLIRTSLPTTSLTFTILLFGILPPPRTSIPTFWLNLNVQTPENVHEISKFTKIYYLKEQKLKHLFLPVTSPALSGVRYKPPPLSPSVPDHPAIFHFGWGGGEPVKYKLKPSIWISIFRTNLICYIVSSLLINIIHKTLWHLIEGSRKLFWHFR